MINFRVPGIAYTPFPWTGIPLRSWRSLIFSKIIPNRRGRSTATRFGDWRFHYASTTLPSRCCYNPTTTMKIRLHLVYADSDAAATLLRTWRWSYAFVALLYPFFIKSEVQLIYFQLNFNDRRAQFAMLQLWTTYLLCWMMRSRHDGGGGPIG